MPIMHESKTHLKKLPLLLLGLMFVFLLWLMLNKTYPDQAIYHFLPISYLPIIFVFFLSCFCISSFLFLNSRRGLLLASGATWIFLLRLNQVQVDFKLILAIALILSLTEIAVYFLDNPVEKPTHNARNPFKKV